ncbi:HEPN domain-containing protein [archaeon]|nr:HEPN domain-containing protein [archaeon]
MKKLSFLSKLKKEGKLELVDPSEEICKSYIEKADNCLKSAKLLLEYSLYENSVSMSYYAMYNSLTALLFKVGIKCENHAGSIILFKKLFGRMDLFKVISFAKEERIDICLHLWQCRYQFCGEWCHQFD